MGRKNYILLKKCLAIGFTFSFVVLAVKSEQAEDSTNSLTNAPEAISVNVRSNVKGTFMPYRYAFISSGQTKHTFLVPDAYRVDSSHPTEVKLVSPGMDCFITVAFHQSTSPSTTEALEEYVKERYSEAVVLGTQPISAAGYTTTSVEFRWKAAADITRISREAFFRTADGTLKIALTASLEKFQEGVDNYNLVLQTFRSSNNGKYDFVIGSNKP